MPNELMISNLKVVSFNCIRSEKATFCGTSIAPLNTISVVVDINGFVKTVELTGGDALDIVSMVNRSAIRLIEKS